MIFGDPYYFGIWLDTVDDWNPSDNKEEGIFAIFIDGDMLPCELPNTSTFLDNSVRSINSFFQIIDDLENEFLFNMCMADRFNFLINTVHFKNENISEEDSFSYWKYCLTDYIDSSSDKDDIWYVSHNEKEKLMYFQKNVLKEVMLKKGTVGLVLKKVIDFNMKA